MRKISILLAFLTASAFAQVPQPQINLTGNVGAQGFPVLNSGVLQFTSDANHTMTAAETSATGGIKVTSTVALTATRNLILPVGNFQFIAVENATTGGQSIQVIGQSGTGVTIANGASATVWFDGTNVVQTGSSGGGSGITALTGAVTASGPGSAAATITPTGVTAATYGGTASSATVAVNTAGQITSATNTPITPNGIGAAVAPTYAVAPVVDYHFQEDGGTTVFDFSGNNYNATLGTASRTPTWVPNGLVFPTGTGVDMPTQSAINSAMTWCWVGNFNTLGQNAFNQSGYSSLMASNDGGTNGVSYTALYVGSLVGGSYGQISGVSSLNTFVNNAAVTSANSTYTGVSRLCVVRGKTSNSTVDHDYINGKEVDSYYVQGKTGDTTNATFYSIGAATTGTFVSGLFGSTLYRATGWTAQLSAAQIQQADQVQQYDLTTRGISIVPVPIYHQLPQFINMGDSITFCQGLSSSVCWNASANIQPLLTNQPTYTEQNFGVTSVTAFSIGANEPGRGTNFCQTSTGPGVLTLWEGTNDLGIFGSLSTQTLVNNVAGAIQKYKLAGCRVYVATTLSRCGNAPGTGCIASGTFEAARAPFNKLLLQQAKSLGADGVVDIASFPYLGATNAYNAGAGGGTCPGATTYFQSDCVHPNATSQPYISQIFANSLNYYTGTTFANPYVVTATATLPSSARVTDATGCTSACTLTLPDGTGPSGETYTIITGPTSVVSVQGQTLYGIAQTVNGSSSTIALPINSTIQLKIVPNAQATAGVHWIIIQSANVAILNASNNFTGSLQTMVNFYASGDSEFGAVVGSSHQVVINPSIAITGYNSGDVPMYSFSNIDGTSNFAGPLTAASAKTTIYTVSTLPSAASLPAGTQVTVSDDTGLPTSNTCTGSGTEYAIAITNGTTWTCH